jgi:hypothetical protein
MEGESMDQLEYRRRYRDQMVKRGVLPGVADDASEACDFDDLDRDYSDPESDADEELTYWDNDGEVKR